MDEQRMRAYLELIQVLLSCPSGQEPAIFNQHQDLLDQGLLRVMAQEVDQLRQQGQENNVSNSHYDDDSQSISNLSV